MLQVRATRAVINNPLRFIIQWVFHRSHVIFVSKFQKQTFLDAGYTFRETTTIYYGLDSLALSETKLKQKLTQNSKIRFGFIGRIHEEKGVFDIIEAACQLKADDVEFTLLIGGDGPAIDELKFKSQENNIPTDWSGWVRDKQDFFDQIDILIVPSRTSSGESFGQVVIESWQHGVPTITSDIGCFTELKKYSTSTDKTLVFQADNSGSLKKVMHTVIDNPQTYISNKESINLNNMVNSTFSVQKTLSEYYKVIKQVGSK